MNDDRKFSALALLSALLVLSILLLNVFQDYFPAEIAGYLKRRIYYERALSGKGLPLHDAKHWRKIDE